MKLTTLFASVTAVAAMAAIGATTASAQSTLDIVKERGFLRCQVGTPSPGFYNLDANGDWYGSDVSICQAVAAAIFGDKGKLEIQSVSSQVRFTALANGESDLLSRTATWTLLRDTQLGLDFTAVNFYDGQGFLVPKDSGITSALDLKGKGKVAQRVLASAAAKKYEPKLKKKKGVQLQARVQKTIPLKFKKSNKTLKRIKKLQKRSKKARKRSKVVVNLILTTTTGVVSDAKVKIKLKA